MSRPRLLDCRLDLHEQLGHLSSPALLRALLDERQFPQVMGMTQTVGNVGIAEYAVHGICKFMSRP